LGAEKQEYIDHIQEIVSWLGWKPWKVRGGGAHIL
jgi:glutaminyl-tRNA synthetase